MDWRQEANTFLRRHEDKERELANLLSAIDTLKASLSEYPSKLELYEEVRVFLQTLAEATRNEVMAGLQEVVTRCLQSVFGPHLTFEIEVETKRNNTGIEFYVVNTEGDHVIRLRPEENMGGGVIDTISIGLRFGLLKVLTPPPKGPIFLDEPAKMVSGDKIYLIANLLKELADIFDKQIVMVTHHQSIIETVEHSIGVRNERGMTVFTQGG